ncbi:toll/interleukin-1 receptor-like protein [Apium graveolens]|uniref:toll/interleukin-1 receptor-like protein n=1 Tax=Apium graveolens TaxID=4045 RepID=UPI003D7BFB7C
MASTSNLEITAASASSSSPPITWDIFLSFYGDDTRRNFTSHLYSALDQAGITTFIDDPALKKGQEISSGLLNAIRDSKIFVVVISENYARSLWCLSELLEIVAGGQKIRLFLFFTMLTHQMYGTRKEVLETLLNITRSVTLPNMTNKWKSALAQIVEVSEYHHKKHANENGSKTIQSIIENIARQVTTKVLHLGEELFGINSAVEEI